MFVIPPLTLDVDTAFSEMDRRRYMFIRDAWLKFGLYDWSGAVSSHDHNNKHRSANLMNDFIGTHLKLERSHLRHCHNDYSLGCLLIKKISSLK